MVPGNYSKTGNRILWFFMVTLFLLATIGCSALTANRGVLNTWRDSALPSFEKGRTTQSEIITVLGPPSQVIGLHNRMIFYYMLERSKLKKIFTLVYNWSDEKVRYDRAIFFFDQKGLLTEYAYSLESIPYEASK
jgi:outer membrane protein assembly factor BamE (lipoprotein component of BamABCDE complex)